MATLHVEDGKHRSLPPWFEMKARTECAWPIFPTDVSAAVGALVNQLLDNEWCERDVILARQARQLRALLTHAAEHSPFHAERIRKSGLNPRKVDSAEALRRLPTMGRADVQESFDRIRARRLPSGTKFGRRLHTSGSSGRPLVVQTTNASALMWVVFTLRGYVWAGIRPGGRIAAIRTLEKGRLPAAHTETGAKLPNWGGRIADAFKTGPAFAMDVGRDVESQARFVERTDPDYLLSFPPNVLILAEAIRERKTRVPRLKLVETISQVLTPEARQTIESVFGVPVFDIYSCVEVGYIASQCPEGHGYHIHEENVIVEVLDPGGRPCKPGEAGEVVLTGLTNFGFPLIRYRPDDFAVLGPPGTCPCGRRLRRLVDIIGRKRGQLISEDGRIRFSSSERMGLRDPKGVRQFQVVQHERTHVELRLVTTAEFGDAQRLAIEETIQSYLGRGVKVTFTLVDRIEPTAGGKYLDFICNAT